MKKTIYTNIIFVVLSALMCTALWGSATPFIKTGYECLKVSGTPSIMLFAGIRFFLAGVITIVIYSFIERKFLYPKKKSIKYVGIISVFQTILQYIFFYVGLANTSGVKGTILSGSSAFFFNPCGDFDFQAGKTYSKEDNSVHYRICGCCCGQFKRS